MAGRRTPPHSKEAEASVIGSCLLSRQSVASCVSALLPADFYDPKLARIFAATTELHAAGAAVDPQTVAAQLDKTNALEEVGGVQALVRIQAATPASANHVHYALAVAELATLRRALEIASAVEDAAYDRKLDEVERLLGAAEQRLCPPLAAVEPGHDLSTLLLADTTYDWKLTGCLEALERLIITGTEGSGKLGALSVRIPTVTGWTTFGDVRPGDRVLGQDGMPTTVLAISDVEIPERAYRLRFSDGAAVVVGGEHLWFTWDYHARMKEQQYAAAELRDALKPKGTDQRDKQQSYPAVRTTDEIAETLRARGDFTWNHSIRACEAAKLDEADLPIGPYTLGYWLGNGSRGTDNVTTGGWKGRIDFPEIEARILAEHETIRSTRREDDRHRGRITIVDLKNRLAALGVEASKDIPPVYLRASLDQRVALLQGLMDSDGYCPDGHGKGRGHGASLCEWSSKDVGLCWGMAELLSTLGIVWRYSTKIPTINGKPYAMSHRLTFQAPFPVFSTLRKAERQVALRTLRSQNRFIVGAELVEPVPMRCIQVDAPDGLFLIGDRFIATHNSTLLRQMAVQLACGVHPFVPHEDIPRCKVLHVDLENSPRQSEREYQRIAKPAVRERYEAGWLSVKYRPQGINLAEKADVRWLEALVVHHEPEFLIVGPLYKMLRETKMASVHSEETAQACAYALDELRVRYGLVMIIEAHSAKGDGRTGVRGLEPIGSSLWLRWPEFGIGLGLRKDGARLVDWRGPRDRNRIWPKSLAYGQSWPWIPAETF